MGWDGMGWDGMGWDGMRGGRIRDGRKIYPGVDSPRMACRCDQCLGSG